MKITFLGAAKTVTGSKYLIEHEGHRLLVDCGLFQGQKNLRKRNWESLPVDPYQINCVALTHAHIDHSGYVPRLVKDGYNGPIYCTPATHALAKILLLDSAAIQEEDAGYANKKGFSKHRPALPLYSVKDVEAALPMFQEVAWERRFFACGPFSLMFKNAGHILGASSLIVEAGGKSILFSGDIGRFNDPLMPAPELAEDCDYIVLESTYGDRLHETDDPVEVMAEIVRDSLKRNSVVLIPSFAVARAQLLMVIFDQVFQKYPELKIPIYVNSPMTNKVTDLYEDFSNLHKLSRQDAERIFSIPKSIEWIKESVKLNEKKGPMVIISASGMLTGGRVLHHLRAFGGDENNLVLLVGFQAEGTRGADLVAGVRNLEVHGGNLEVKARVRQLNIFSAHADREELLQWIAHTKKTKNIFLVHGEEAGLEGVEEAVIERFDFPVEIAENGRTVEL